MKYQKSVNEFRNESRHEIERNKPMVRLHTRNARRAFCMFPRNCGMRKCQYNGKCRNARDPKCHKPRMRKCQKPKMLERQYNTEVTPSLVLSNPN